MLRLLSPMRLVRLLVRFVVTNDAACGCAGGAVVSRKMPGDATDQSAFYAALGLGRRGSASTDRCNNDAFQQLSFHGNSFYFFDC